MNLNLLGAALGHNPMLHHEDHEEHEEERGKEALCDYDLPVQSGQGPIENVLCAFAPSRAPNQQVCMTGVIEGPTISRNTTITFLFVNLRAFVVKKYPAIS